MLWDMVSLEYRLNETIALTGTVGQQTIIKAGDSNTKGTQLFVYPHAQIFASSSASITADVVPTIDQITMTGADTKAIIDVPLVVKIVL